MDVLQPTSNFPCPKVQTLKFCIQGLMWSEFKDAFKCVSISLQPHAFHLFYPPCNLGYIHHFFNEPVFSPSCSCYTHFLVLFCISIPPHFIKFQFKYHQFQNTFLQNTPGTYHLLYYEGIWCDFYFSTSDSTFISNAYCLWEGKRRENMCIL